MDEKILRVSHRFLADFRMIEGSRQAIGIGRSCIRLTEYGLAPGLAIAMPPSYRRGAPQNFTDILETASYQRSTRLVRLKWRLEWGAQTAAEQIIARLPGTWVFRMGQGVGRLLWHLMPSRRRTVIKNLRIVLATEEPMERIEQVARESFIRSVANLLSAVHTAHLSSKVLESRIHVENPEVLAAVTSGGKGCVLLPPHMGNWEILSRITRLYPEGHELGALYRPLNNPYLDARLAARRQSEGTRMFSKRDSLLAITSFLKEGGLIGVLADQRVGYQGLSANFFGRLTRVSSLPQLLMRRCKVPGVAVSIRTTAPGRWALKYHPVAEPRDTAACADAIECAMRESLVDVFWFQDRWKCYFSEDHALRSWLGDEHVRSKKSPHRALIWLVDAPLSVPLPDEWQHPDVAYELVLGEGQQAPSWAADSARIHRVAPASGSRALRAQLRSIDRAWVVPVDFVWHPQENPLLKQACHREGLIWVSI